MPIQFKMIDIKRIDIIDEDVVDAFKVLIAQLTEKDQYPSKEDLESIVSSELNHLFVAKDENGKIVGSMTLVLYRIPTGFKGMIEDVVVDHNARGKGVATSLINHAIETARKCGAYKLELTSRPARIAANKMYLKMGFELRDTNFYRLDL